MIRLASVEERFWAKVAKAGPDDCWFWTGALKDKRREYGCFRAAGRNVRAHRFAWELANGEDPGDLYVCHRCDNPRCCNPAHLFLGTQADNMGDCARKGRKTRGEANHAKITEAQVREIRHSSTSCYKLADRMGLSRSYVTKIRRGEKWRHVT